MDYSDKGIDYVWAWPKDAAPPVLAAHEVDYYLTSLTAAGCDRASWYGSKALKWGASPEQVALALAAVAS